MIKMNFNEGMQKIKVLRVSGEIEFDKVSGEVRFECQKDARCCRIYPIISSAEFPTKPGAELFKDSNEECSFLERSVCSIYDHKPVVCKAYPFHMSPLTNELYYDKKCPGIGKGDVVSKEKLEDVRADRLLVWGSFLLSNEQRQIIHDVMFE